MANPIGSSSGANKQHQEMAFEQNDKSGSNSLGIQNLANNYEEIQTKRKRKNKLRETKQFIVTDIQGK